MCVRALLTLLLMSLCLANAGLSVANANDRLSLNLASRILMLYRDGQKLAIYPVAVGAPDTPTPEGQFSIVEMVINPTWINPADLEEKIPPGADNPLGSRWIGIGGHYGIHGTNKPWSIGDYASNGCVRMRARDVESLYDIVDIGDTVSIKYERLVIEHLPTDMVVVYVYPDYMDRESLEVEDVREELRPYGLENVADDDELYDKIDESDGTPLFLGPARKRGKDIES